MRTIFSVCDIALLVESDYAHYTVKPWWAAACEPWWMHPPVGKAVAQVIYACPDDGWSMRVAVALSKHRGANYVYVFDGSSPTYDHLPRYWDAEVAAVADASPDPCQMLADVAAELGHTIDELAARAASTPGDSAEQLAHTLSQLRAQRAEIAVVQHECQEG